MVRCDAGAEDRLPALHLLRPVICSSYLPDWRPGVGYHTVYFSAHRRLGGGVTTSTLIHEWDYLVELFGVPEKWPQFQMGPTLDLEIPIPTISRLHRHASIHAAGRCTSTTLGADIAVLSSFLAMTAAI